MVPGDEASGLVAPSIVRPVFTTSFPCQTIATIGPEFMSNVNYCIQVTIHLTSLSISSANEQNVPWEKRLRGKIRV